MIRLHIYRYRSSFGQLFVLKFWKITLLKNTELKNLQSRRIKLLDQ